MMSASSLHTAAAVTAEPILPRLLAQALPHLPEVIALHNPDGSYRLLSPTVRSMTGWRSSDLIGRSAYELIHPDDIPNVQRKYHDAMLCGASVRGRLRYRHQEGHYIWLEFNGVPLFDAPDRPREVSALLTVSRDVTPLVKAEKMAIEQRQHLLQMQDLAGLAWFSVDLKSGRLRHSESFVEITGRAASTFSNLLSLYRLVHPSDRAWVHGALNSLQHTTPGESRTVKVRITTVHKQTRWVRMSLTLGASRPDAPSESRVLSGVLLDIDDLVLSGEETRRWVRQQEIHSARERLEIGHELHDEVGQILTGLKWQIEAWQRENVSNTQTAQWLTSLDEAHHTLRGIAQRLRPPLASLGLRAAILKLTSEYTERWLGSTRLDLQVDDDLPDGDEWRVNVILGMLRECLNNVVRHARAEKVTVVALATPTRGLQISVRDNGIGMDLNEQTNSHHIGLTSLRERAHMINAHLTIDSAPGQGTCIAFEAWLDGGPDE